MRSTRTIAWIVGLTDFAITYAYVFIANALPFERSGPSAPSTYWLTQLWVYALIAPVACVATWRGVRQFQRLRRGHDRWWRLPLEAAVIGAAPVVFVALFEQAAVFRAIFEGAGLSAGLGVILYLANTLASRIVAVDAPATPPQFLDLPYNER